MKKWLGGLHHLKYGYRTAVLNSPSHKKLHACRQVAQLGRWEIFCFLCCWVSVSREYFNIKELSKMRRPALLSAVVQSILSSQVLAFSFIIFHMLTMPQWNTLKLGTLSALADNHLAPDLHHYSNEQWEQKGGTKLHDYLEITSLCHGTLWEFPQTL